MGPTKEALELADDLLRQYGPFTDRYTLGYEIDKWLDKVMER